MLTLTESQYKMMMRERKYRMQILKYMDTRTTPVDLASIKKKAVGDQQMLTEQWYWLIRRKYIAIVAGSDKHGGSMGHGVLAAKGHAMLHADKFDFRESEMQPYLMFFNQICTGRGRDLPKWKY